MVDEPEQPWKEEASRPETSAQRLIELSADPQLHRIITANPSAPGNLLAQLAQNKDHLIRKAIASNPNTPWHTLQQLAWEFPHEFLHNPAGPFQMLALPEHIDTNSEFWGTLLREASIPSLWWSWLTSHSALRTSQAVLLHVQHAGEATHPYDFSSGEDEEVLLTLVELLTAACEQEETSEHAREKHAISARPAPLSQHIIGEYLQWLAQAHDSEVRQAVASHPQTPVEVLRRLAQDQDPLVRKEVAGQKLIPGEILHMLAQDSDPRVRQGMARREQIPEEILYTLAQDEDGKVRQAVTRRSHIPVDILRMLTQDEDTWIRHLIASHSQVPAEALLTLAQDKEVSVREAVAENPHTPVEALLILAQNENVEIRWGVASHPQMPVEVLYTLARDEHEYVRSNVAENLQTPANILRLLSLDQDERVRSTVASHPCTPEEVLRILAEDKERFVRQMVAKNPQTPGEVLHQLCHDPQEWVRSAVARNPHTPEDALRTLASNVPQNTDVYHNLGLAVAMHPHASAEVLHLLTRYPHVLVRLQARFVQKLLATYGDEGREQAWWAELRRLFVNAHNSTWIGIFSIETQLEEIAALDIPEHLRQMVITALAARWDNKHTFTITDKRDAATILHARLTFYKHLLSPLLPPVALQKLAVSPHWEVRYLMAIHEKTPWESRQILSQDGNRYVRAMARANSERIAQTSTGE